MREYVNSRALGRRIGKHFGTSRSSQKAVAAKFGVDPSRISRIYRGEFKTAKGLVAIICKDARINCQKFAVTPGASRNTVAGDSLLARLSSLTGDEAREMEHVLQALLDCLVLRRNSGNKS